MDGHEKVSSMHPRKAVVKPLVTIHPNQVSFTIRQGAVYSGLGEWRIRMAVWEGRLPARRDGKSLIILRSDIDDFLRTLPLVAPNQSDWLARRAS
jgi:hypothetical protein